MIMETGEEKKGVWKAGKRMNTKEIK